MDAGEIGVFLAHSQGCFVFHEPCLGRISVGCPHRRPQARGDGMRTPNHGLGRKSAAFPVWHGGFGCLYFLKSLPGPGTISPTSQDAPVRERDGSRGRFLDRPLPEWEKDKPQMQTTSTQAGQMGEVIPERTGAWPLPREIDAVPMRLELRFGRPENRTAMGVRPAVEAWNGVAEAEVPVTAPRGDALRGFVDCAMGAPPWARHNAGPSHGGRPEGRAESEGGESVYDGQILGKQAPVCLRRREFLRGDSQSWRGERKHATGPKTQVGCHVRPPSHTGKPQRWAPCPKRCGGTPTDHTGPVVGLSERERLLGLLLVTTAR